jgi:hypothetical protein
VSIRGKKLTRLKNAEIIDGTTQCIENNASTLLTDDRQQSEKVPKTNRPNLRRHPSSQYYSCYTAHAYA